MPIEIRWRSSAFLRVRWGCYGWVYGWGQCRFHPTPNQCDVASSVECGRHRTWHCRSGIHSGFPANQTTLLISVYLAALCEQTFGSGAKIVCSKVRWRCITTHDVNFCSMWFFNVIFAVMGNKTNPGKCGFCSTKVMKLLTGRSNLRHMKWFSNYRTMPFWLIREETGLDPHFNAEQW